MPKIPLIGDFSVSELKNVIHYDPSTGIVDRHIRKYLRTDRKIPFGSITNTFGKSYIRLQLFGRLYMAHRIIWFYVHGVWPKYIDHIDGNGMNNKLCNLREVDIQENLKNKRIYTKNTTGVSGVVYLEKTNNYKVDIVINKQKIYLGRHASIFEAACAKKSAENKYGFHENHGSIRPL